MTLKEKLKKQLDTATPTLNRPHYQSGKLEKIADEFAIGFVVWLSEESYNLDSYWKPNHIEELLEIYKKTL